MYENTYKNKDAQKTSGTSQIDIPLLQMNGGDLLTQPIVFNSTLISSTIFFVGRSLFCGP